MPTDNQVFTANGTFTVPAGVSSVKVLVVAGGGGGGSFGSFSNGAGGGGGGGFIYDSAYGVTAGQSISITIGSGGAAGNSGAGGNGGNSVFGTLTAIGGGGGGGYTGSAFVNPGDGGSGGGGAGAGTGTQAGGTGTAGPPRQGYAGGTTTGGGAQRPASGGGGGSAAGTSISSNENGGNGGAGYDASAVFGTDYGVSGVFCGGGGGGRNTGTAGSGGSGGGGGGGSGGAGTQGTANTGGGGGGGGGSNSAGGGAGADGIVIVMYDLTVTGLTIKTSPTKTTYDEGQTLDLSGLVVTLTYSDDSTADVAFADFGSNGITASPVNGAVLTTSDTEVTITHTASSESDVQSITVNPGEWGIFIQEYQGSATAEDGTTTTNIEITGHGLATGDAIVNTTRMDIVNDVLASRRVTRVDDNNLTVEAVASQAEGDSIRLYKHVDRTEYVKTNSLRLVKRNDRTSAFNVSFHAENDWIPQTGQDIQLRNGSTIVWGGTIKSVRRRMVYETPACDTLIYDVYSEGYNHIPTRRTVAMTWDDTDAGTIVEYLRDVVLVDELIGAGTIESGISINEYDVTDNVRAILDHLADASGYKWYIDDSRNLHFVAEDVVADAAHALVDDNGYQEYSEVELDEQMEEYRNKQFVVGGLDDDGMDAAAVIRNIGQIQSRMEIEGSSGVYGDVYNDSQIETDDDAHTTAVSRLRQWGSTVPARLSFRSLDTDWRPNTKLEVELETLAILPSYYLIEEVEIRDFTGNTGGTFLESRVMATRRAISNFGSHAKEDYITYFGRLVEFAKEKQSGKAGAASTTACTTGANAAQVDVDDEGETTAVSIDVEVPSRSKAVLMFTCEITIADGACDLTAKTYIAGDAQTYQPTNYMAGANKYTFSYHDTIERIGPGTKTFAVKLQTSANGGAIAIGHAVLTVLLFSDAVEGLDDVTGFTATAVSTSQIDLAWTNPTTPYFSEVELYRHVTSISQQNRTWCAANATKIYNGTDESYENTGLAAQTTYYYKIFAAFTT
jgi:hypothetical protein